MSFNGQQKTGLFVTPSCTQLLPIPATKLLEYHFYRYVNVRASNHALQDSFRLILDRPSLLFLSRPPLVLLTPIRPSNHDSKNAPMIHYTVEPHKHLKSGIEVPNRRKIGETQPKNLIPPEAALLPSFLRSLQSKDVDPVILHAFNMLSKPYYRSLVVKRRSSKTVRREKRETGLSTAPLATAFNRNLPSPKHLYNFKIGISRGYMTYDDENTSSLPHKGRF